jgi:long-subunit acyl-CoA synthetase (AMP-forming)
VLCFDDVPNNPTHSYNHWMKQVENEPAAPETPVTPSDVTVIIYTSGTTGNVGTILSIDEV